MDWLAGKQIVFTGKLASMTRKEAARVIARHGGKPAADVSRQTAYVIVGQEGWPLQKDGKLTAKLERAGQLRDNGLPITILSEDEFLARLGRADDAEGVHRLCSLAQLTRILQVPGDRLRAWVQEGLIRSQQQVEGVDYFDFRQVVGAKTLCEMLQAGVSLERVRRSLRQLQDWLRVDQPLAQLALLEQNGQLLVRVEEGLADASGQMFLDFGDDAAETIVPVRPTSADEWFDLGCQHEDEGRPDEAIDAYRHALLLSGPDADTCFNLASVLRSTGRREQASERYRQVVEIDGSYAEAWNNLGVLLVEMNEFAEAEEAFRRALALHFGDAHYNLADLLEATGRAHLAREHWQAFLRTNPEEPWRRYVRGKLSV